MIKLTMEAARMNKKMTQQDIADALGVSRKTVGLWESGKRKMKTVYVHMFCDVVGITEDDLLLP